MLRGEFYRKVKQLNPKLQIVCHNTPTFAGIGYFDEKEGWTPVGIVDKDSSLKEYTEYDTGAHIVKTGWRRPIIQIVGQKMASREKVKKVFGPSFFENRHKDVIPTAVDPVKHMLAEKMAASMDRNGNSALSNEDIKETAEVLDKITPERTKAKMEKEEWHLKKDPEKYVRDAGEKKRAKAQGSFTNDPNAWPKPLDVPAVERPTN